MRPRSVTWVLESTYCITSVSQLRCVDVGYAPRPCYRVGQGSVVCAYKGNRIYASNTHIDVLQDVTRIHDIPDARRGKNIVKETITLTVLNLSST
eukprot:jgi/Botrbrau1/2746/Bobra.0164s0026.1